MYTKRISIFYDTFMTFIFLTLLYVANQKLKKVMIPQKLVVVNSKVYLITVKVNRYQFTANPQRPN